VYVGNSKPSTTYGGSANGRGAVIGRGGSGGFSRGSGVASSSSSSSIRGGKEGADRFKETWRDREESDASGFRTVSRFNFTPGAFEAQPPPLRQRESAPSSVLLPAIAAASPSSTTTSAKLCCDKCDGKHLTDDCPYYKKGRDAHPDAQKNFYKKLGGTSTLPGQNLPRNSKVIRQPGDGSCLFHSMSFGLSNGGTAINASRLRAEICEFIRSNPGYKICETPLEDWIKWDSGGSCGTYAAKMSRGSWGGGIEMAVASHIKGVNVHVYERAGFTSLTGGYRRISAFDHPDNPERRKCVKVLYQGGVHYDALA